MERSLYYHKIMKNFLFTIFISRSVTDTFCISSYYSVLTHESKFHDILANFMANSAPSTMAAISSIN